MYVVLVALCLLPLAVAGQVLYLTLGRGEELRALGQRQASSFVSIPAIRGAILDRNGRLLAVNTARYELAVDPTVEGWTPETARTFFDRLAELTGTRRSYFSRRVRSAAGRRYVPLLRNLNEAQKEEIDTWKMPGLILTPEFARRYNYGTTAAHVLGYVDRMGNGVAGVERQLDAVLRGSPGRRAVLRDRLGAVKAYVGGPVVEPRNGETVVLTIDLVRQAMLEEELARGVAESGARWGTAIAMDPHTGAILAMANAPTYDPNRPGSSSADARRNKAITDRMEPGSTFKLVTAIAAVEQGKVRIDETIDTGDGQAEFGGRTLRDAHAVGRVSFEEAIAHSSNVALAKVGSRLQPGLLYRYARQMGFGQPTMIDLPGEAGGLLKKPSVWSRTTQSRMSIGYEVDVTPLQTLAAYAALANGGVLVRPYVVAERRDLAGRTVWRAMPDSVRRAFRAETARYLMPAFTRVVTDGTAKLAEVPGLPVAGKTGTAVRNSGGVYMAGHYRTTFVGFFPADDPQVALIVVLDDPVNALSGGTASAPVFGRVATRWVGTFPRLAERVAPAPRLAASPARPVPRVQALPLAVAEARLAAAGYRPEAKKRTPAAAVVSGQWPEAGAVAAPGTPVRLTAVSARASRMPDLKGLSARQALYVLSSRGVEARVDGSGAVVEQSTPPGAALPKRVVLRCR